MRAKDIRKGNVIIYNKAPYRVMEFAHRTPGNLRAFVQIKMRNLMSGAQTEQRFASDDELEFADLFTYKAQYLYSDGDGSHFMNIETYDQIALNEDIVGDAKYYLQEGITVEISTLDERPISLTLPKTVEMLIEDTTPELRGATASNSPKPARTTTGLQLTVPPFLKIGDKIVVDTEDGSYLSRAD